MTRKMQKELVDQFSKLVSSGLGLVAALAWNDAIQELFRKLTAVFGARSTLIAKFAYAILVTVLVVIISVRLAVLMERLGRDNEQGK